MMHRYQILESWVKKINKAKSDAHAILAKHESAPSRIILLEDLPKKLNGKPIDIQNYFKEAIKCLEHNLFRAAVVLSWSGFLHILVEYMFMNYKTKLRNVRNKWNFKDIDDLKVYPEHQLIDVAKDLKIISKAQHKKYIGQLATRNQCAHPTLYSPSLNSAIGYVDDMIYQSEKFL